MMRWLFLLLSCLSCFGQIGQSKIGQSSLGGGGSGGGGGGGCTTLSESWGTSSGILIPWGRTPGTAANEQWISSVWIASNNIVDCKITFTNFTVVGSPSDSVVFQIYSDGGDKPGSDLTSGGVTLSSSSITTGNLTVSLTMSSKTSGTHYWVVIHRTVTNDSNRFSIQCSEDEPYMFIAMTQKSPDGTTWSTFDQNQNGFQMSLYHN